jgi:myosin heavy subunit
VAAVLHLGNLKFVATGNGEQAAIENTNVLATISSLLGVDSARLSKALVYPERQAGKGVMNVSKNAIAAAASRDSLARQLYNRMFLWVVSRINETFTVTNDNFIGTFGIDCLTMFRFVVLLVILFVSFSLSFVFNFLLLTR